MIIQIVGVVIGCLLSAIGTILVFQFSGMNKSIVKVVGSINTLNIQIAEVIKDLSWHKSEIKSIKLQISEVKRKVDK